MELTEDNVKQPLSGICLLVARALGLQDNETSSERQRTLQTIFQDTIEESSFCLLNDVFSVKVRVRGRLAWIVCWEWLSSVLSDSCLILCMGCSCAVHVPRVLFSTLEMALKRGWCWPHAKAEAFCSAVLLWEIGVPRPAAVFLSVFPGQFPVTDEVSKMCSSERASAFLLTCTQMLQKVSRSPSSGLTGGKQPCWVQALRWSCLRGWQDDAPGSWPSRNSAQLLSFCRAADVRGDFTVLHKQSW